jgi:hypothetical protein
VHLNFPKFWPPVLPLLVRLKREVQAGSTPGSSSALRGSSKKLQIRCMTPGSSGTPPEAVRVVIRGVIRQFTCVFEGSTHMIYQDIVSSVALTRKVHVVTTGSIGR